jgi:hypothetical protein
MKKYILLAGCLAVVVGATPLNRGAGALSFAGGSTPRFSEASTWCAVGDTESVCRLMLVGMGRDRDASITLDVMARRVFSCVSATGQIVSGHTEKVYMGTTTELFRSEQDGTVEGELRGSLDWKLVREEALQCQAGYRVVPDSDTTETSWQLTAVGQKRTGLFNAAYTSAM